MPQLFYKDGSPIPEAKIPEAIASKEAFAKDSRIRVRDSSGNVGSIDVSELSNPNYTPLSDQEIEADRIHKERGTVGQQAITAGEGALRGATLGLSDAAAVGVLGDDYRKAADERRGENSKIALASELGGAIAPSLLSGGAGAEVEAASLAARAGGAVEEGSALARGAGAVARTVGAPVRAVSKLGGLAEKAAGSVLSGLGLEGEGLAARAAGKAVKLGAAGAAEGAIFGAGSTLSESTLNGDPLTAEALVAGMGHGALFGGVLGAGAGAAGELAPALLSKVLPSKEKLEGTAVGFARKQLGRDFEKVGKGQSREVAEQWKDASAKQLLERKLVGGENAGKTVLEASSKPQDIADNLGQMRRDIGEELAATRERAAQVIDATPAAAPNTEELFGRFDKYISDLKRTKVAGNYSLARTAEREIAPLRRALMAEPVAVQGEAGALLGGAMPANDAPSVSYRELLNWHQNLERSLNPAGIAKSMRGVAIKNFGAKEEIAKIANAYLKETTAHALTLGGEDGTIVSRLHQEYAGTIAMQQAAEKEATRVASNRRVSLTDHMLGIGSALLAMSSGNLGSLATMGFGAAAAIGNKIAREQGNAIMAQMALKGSRMTSLVDTAAHSLALSASSLTKPIAALETSVHDRPFVPLGAKVLKEDFEKTRDRVRELTDPAHQQAQLAYATESVHSAYPEAAAGMNQQLIRAHQYLAAALPAQQGGNPLSPNARPTAVPLRDMAKFLSKANAVMSPESVIKDIARGRIDEDSVDALQNVYPSIFNQLKERVMQNVAANKEEMPFQRVIHISAVFGFDGDSSLAPERFAGIQQSIQQINAPPPNQNAPGSPGPTRKAKPGSPKTGSPYKLPGQATPGEH